MRKVKIGCPGFILREALAQDFEGTLAHIGQMGFDGFEITGFFGRQAEKIREICNKYGLEVFGAFAMSHNMLCKPVPASMSGWDDLLQAMNIPAQTPDEVMEYIKKLGAQYIGLCMTNTQPTQEVFDEIYAVNELANRHGLKVQYHNHNWEFFNMVNGERRIEHIFKNVPKNVLFEPDIGWIGIGGYDPMKALKKYRERIEIVHLKDYFRKGNIFDVEQPFEFRPTGYGVLDWPNLIAYCENCIQPVWYVADHDAAVQGDIFHELELSLRYIRDVFPYCDYALGKV